MIFYVFLSLSIFTVHSSNSIITYYPIDDKNIDYILVMRIEEATTYHSLYKPNQTLITTQLEDLILESDLMVNITSNLTLWDWFHLIAIYHMPIVNSTILVYQTTPHLETFTASIYSIVKAIIDDQIGFQMISKVTNCACHLCDDISCDLQAICKRINYLHHIKMDISGSQSNQSLDKYFYRNDDYCFTEASVLSVMDIIRPKRGIYSSHIDIQHDKISCFCNNCPGRFICVTRGSCFSTIFVQYINDSHVSSFEETLGCVEDNLQAEYCKAIVIGEERYCCKKAFCNNKIPAKIKIACYCTSCEEARLCITEGSCYMEYNSVTKKRVFGCFNKNETKNWCAHRSTDFTISCCQNGAFCNRMIHEDANSLIPYYKITEVYNVGFKKRSSSRAEFRLACECGNCLSDHLCTTHGSCSCRFKTRDAKPSYCCANNKSDTCCSQSTCGHSFPNLDKEIVIVNYGHNATHCLELGSFVKPDPTEVMITLDKDSDENYEWKFKSHVHLKMSNSTNYKMLATMSFINISDEDCGRYIFKKWYPYHNITQYTAMFIVTKSKILGLGENGSISFMVPDNQLGLDEIEYKWIRPSFVSINDSHINTLYNESQHTISVINYRDRLNGTYQLNIINNVTREVIRVYMANFITRETAHINVTVRVGKTCQLLLPNIYDTVIKSERMLLTKLYDKRIWLKSKPFRFLRRNKTSSLAIKISDQLIEEQDAGTYILDNENGINLRILILITKSRKITSITKGSDIRVTFSLPNIHLKNNRLHIVWHYPKIELPFLHANVSFRLNETHTSLIVRNVTKPYDGTYYLHINDYHNTRIYYFYREYKIAIIYSLI